MVPSLERAPLISAIASQLTTTHPYSVETEANVSIDFKLM
jgi:hypothetical protein